MSGNGFRFRCTQAMWCCIPDTMMRTLNPDGSEQAWRFPGGSDGKESSHNAGDPGAIPGSGSSLEKEMTIHSSILAWRIPWTEETGRLQSTGLQTVRHDLATNASGQAWRRHYPPLFQMQMLRPRGAGTHVRPPSSQ